MSSFRPLRQVIVEKAWESFNHLGYKKTTMDDVAKAAGVSRQTVYAHFTTKEALLCAVADLGLAPRLEYFKSCLNNRTLAIEDRLLNAFHNSLSDLVGSEVAHELSTVAEKYERLARDTTIDLVTQALENTYVSRRWAKLGISPKVLATNLVITSRGIREISSSPEEYGKHMRAAVLVLCLGTPVL